MAADSAHTSSFAAGISLSGLVLPGLATVAAIAAAALGSRPENPAQHVSGRSFKWTRFTSIRVAPQPVQVNCDGAPGSARKEEGGDAEARGLSPASVLPLEGSCARTPRASTPAGSGTFSATHSTFRAAPTLAMASSRELVPSASRSTGMLRGQVSSEVLASTGSGILARRSSSRLVSSSGRRRTARLTRAGLMAAIGILAGILYTAAWALAVREPNPLAFYRIIWADAVLRGLAVTAYFLAAGLFVATWHEGLVGQRSRSILPCSWPVLAMALPVGAAAGVAIVAGVVANTPGWGSGNARNIRNMVERILLSGRVVPALLAIALPVWKGIPVARKLSQSTLPAVKRVGRSTVSPLAECRTRFGRNTVCLLQAHRTLPLP